ncbi:heterokaryon incompatibility protein-domain-containing protein [Xylaria telfairii]|nr:heterokaryon incompatibility protein-domain-containing protein [Xylaria telfairii]
MCLGTSQIYQRILFQVLATTIPNSAIKQQAARQGTETKALRLADRDSTLGNHNLLQQSQQSQVTAGGAGESSATGTSGERAVDEQIATKRQLAPRPVPVLSGYRVPVATTVGDTKTIEWANPNAASIPLATGQAVVARGSPMLTTLSFTTGQAGTSEGAVFNLAQMPMFSTTRQVETATPSRPEEVEESPLRMIAMRARAQLQQDLRVHQQLLDFQQACQPEVGLDGLGGVLGGYPHPPLRRFEAPRNEFACQQRYAVDRRLLGKPIFIEDHSKDPITTPPKDKKAHSAEFAFRLNLHAGRETLKTIRLLQAVWSPALIEKRDIIDTDEIPEYMALSYTWGAENPTRAISINGTIVQVRNNLARALQSITHFDPSMYVWADAICINQQDEREKSRIVPQIPDIFAGAWLVYAWLGPAQDSSTKDLLRHFSDLGKLFWQQAGSTDFDDKLSESRFKHPPGKQGVFPTEEYSSFSASPFWSRIWVLQEVYLAKRLYYACGSCYVASNLLAGALILLEAFQRHLIRTQASALEDSVPVRDESDELLRKFALKLPSFPEMHRLIVYTSIYPIDVISLRIAMTNFCVKELPGGSKATDPKDMIYGLMGFSDYGKSVQEIYTAVTRAMIRNGFTDILSWAQSDAKRIPYLPSWSLCSQGQAKPWLPQFRACNETKYSHDETIQPFSPLVMSVRGRRLDHVTRVGRRWFPRSGGGSAPSSTGNTGALLARSVSYEDLRFFLDEICEFAQQAENIYRRLFETRGIGQIDKKRLPFSGGGTWRVPCCDQMVINGRLVRGDPSTASRYEAMMGYLKAYGQEPEKESLMRWADRRPFVTEHGFVGLGAGNTTPGDTLAVLDGFNACYLVRLESVPRLGYRLVGEAYVDGIMDGEMVGSIPDTRVRFHLV